MSRKDIKKRLHDGMARAAREAQAVRSMREAGSLDEEELAGRLRRYVLAKYRLGADEAGDESGLEALAQLSLDKTMREAPDFAARETMSATCDGADSTVTKHALLMVAIQKDFDVAFNGFDVAYAETVADIARLVWEYYARGAAATREESIAAVRAAGAGGSR